MRFDPCDVVVVVGHSLFLQQMVGLVQTPVDGAWYGPYTQARATPGSGRARRAYGRGHRLMPAGMVHVTAGMVHVTNLTPQEVPTLVGRMVKTPIDDRQTPIVDSRYGPCNQSSDTPREWIANPT
jgi:hypothetical protein